MFSCCGPGRGMATTRPFLSYKRFAVATRFAFPAPSLSRYFPFESFHVLLPILIPGSSERPAACPAPPRLRFSSGPDDVNFQLSTPEIPGQIGIRRTHLSFLTPRARITLRSSAIFFLPQSPMPSPTWDYTFPDLLAATPRNRRPPKTVASRRRRTKRQDALRHALGHKACRRGVANSVPSAVGPGSRNALAFDLTNPKDRNLRN